MANALYPPVVLQSRAPGEKRWRTIARFKEDTNTYQSTIASLMSKAPCADERAWRLRQGGKVILEQGG